MEGIRRRRPSEQQEQQSPTLTSALHKIESALPSLLHWDDLPPWRRDNAFLLTSYRHDTPSLTHVVKSALTLHNETVNIWSHLLAAVFFAGVSWWAYVVVKPRYEASADTADVLVFAAYLAGAVACLGMSATYHAVSSHSETVARLGNKLDYGGIVALIVGSFIPTLYYGFFCRPSLMVPYMSMIVLLGAACAAFACVDVFRTPAWRPYRASMFVALGLSGVIPVVHGLVLDGLGTVDQRMGLRYVLVEAALYISGAGLYVMRFPERRFPRVFDIWGSSHQIFHICVVCACMFHFYGLCQAFDNHHNYAGAACT
jgi:adiponectin receptor